MRLQIILVLASLLSLPMVLGACGDDSKGLNSIVPGEQSSALEEDLLHLREEEKLARDVYIVLHEKWGTELFLSISKSEQQHTDRVKELLAAFEIADPVTDDTVGVFKSEELAELYADLVEMGMMSEQDALLVGATIEDLDIFDIREMRTRTEHSAVMNVYDALECGSNNHMRSFTKKLDDLGVQYDIQFLTESDYQTILGESSGSCGGRR